MQRVLKANFLAVAATLSFAAAPPWNSAPWLADLAQVRLAVDHDYPNRDWLTGQREVSLDRWFGATADAIRNGDDDQAARDAFDRLIRRFDDGHVALTWPAPSGESRTQAEAPPVATVAAFCTSRGYDARQVTVGTATALPGYRAIDAGPFATGTVLAKATTVGIIRIGIFSPQGYPALCEQAVVNKRIVIGKPCDDACDDRLTTEAYALLSQALMEATVRLRAAGAQVLLVDLTGNGGGSEWAEAAARIVAPVSLRSEPLRVIRGEAWVRRWRALAVGLRHDAEGASPIDHTLLASLAMRADVIADGLQPCPTDTCPALGEAGFASGLLAELPAGRLDGRKWGSDVFSPAQFPYHDSAWKRPVIVLVDGETWSAAEQFTALLRDNNAAVVLGGRTGGAGCGHLEGDTPIVLANSRGVLELPNCSRFRRDGSNEVSGIVPDIVTGVRVDDGAAYAGRLTAAHLAAAVAEADAQFTRRAH